MVDATTQRNQDALLLEYMRRLDGQKEGRKAVFINLSALQPMNRREQHVRAAASSFEDIVSSLAGQMFVLQDTDLLCIYKSEASGQVDNVVQRVRFLFSDDPLLDDDASQGTEFATWFDVERDYDDLFALVRKHTESADGAKPKGGRSNVRAALKAKQEHGDPLTPEVLYRAEKALLRTDLSSLVRRQFVCSVDKNMVPEAQFSELYISIMDLREIMLPGVNLMSNRWLFQHLTESLDRRMLSMLAKTDSIQMTGDISFNVNVSTILSNEFLAFDDNIYASQRGSMVVELQKVDIFADLSAFFFAREFAQEKGYRVALDGLSFETMQMIDRERLGVDLIKVFWSGAMIDGGDTARNKMEEMVKRAGPSKVVLCRCDNREAIDFGRAVGISQFQGRYVETLIAEDERRRELLRLQRRIERGG